MRAALLATLLPIGLLTPVASQQEPESLPSALATMMDLDWIGWRVPPAGERCVQFSSYDRGSDAGARSDGWYANGDRGNYLRVVDGVDGEEHGSPRDVPRAVGLRWRRPA